MNRLRDRYLELVVERALRERLPGLKNVIVMATPEGRVTLVGHVDTESECQVATTVASQVAGVNQVFSYLAVGERKRRKGEVHV